MTGDNSQQTAKVFILVFILLGAVIFGFWQMAKKNTDLHVIQVSLPEKTTSTPMVIFNDDTITKVSIGKATILAEVAQSNEKKKQGLGMREKLEPGTGMLFAFNNPGPCPNSCSFWNKDMLFPIDMIWIYDDVVVDIYEHLPSYAESKDFTVTPKNKVNFILEVSDGFIKENNITIGDKVTYESEKN